MSQELRESQIPFARGGDDNGLEIRVKMLEQASQKTEASIANLISTIKWGVGICVAAFVGIAASFVPLMKWNVDRMDRMSAEYRAEQKELTDKWHDLSQRVEILIAQFEARNSQKDPPN